MGVAAHFDSSRSANSRGRSTILRLRSRLSETVAVVALSLPDVTLTAVSTLAPLELGGTPATLRAAGVLGQRGYRAAIR